MYFQCDHFTKVKRSGECGKCGGEEKCIQGVFLGGGGVYEQRDHLQDPGVDGSIILKRIVNG
jgi:hypothetical protein